MGGRVGELIEPALERRGRRLGVDPGSADALMPEEALQVCDVHAEREQAGRYGVAKQVRVDAFLDSGGDRDSANDLADPLAGEHMRRRAGALLPAGEERPRSSRADMKPEQLRQLPPDRHLSQLVALAVAD